MFVNLIREFWKKFFFLFTRNFHLLSFQIMSTNYVLFLCLFHIWCESFETCSVWFRFSAFIYLNIYPNDMYESPSDNCKGKRKCVHDILHYLPWYCAWVNYVWMYIYIYLICPNAKSFPALTSNIKTLIHFKN